MSEPCLTCEQRSKEEKILLLEESKKHKSEQGRIAAVNSGKQGYWMAIAVSGKSWVFSIQEDPRTDSSLDWEYISIR